MTILITGGSGYIGTLLIKRLLKEPGVKKIISVDLNPRPAEARDERVIEIQADLALPDWQEQAAKHGPIDAIIHAAFKIRNPYGKTQETQENNINSALNVFSFCFTQETPRLVYLSSVAAYGARPENIGTLLSEAHPLKEQKNPYGVQKRLVEELLKDLVDRIRPKTHISVLRLNSVTGPVGQSMKSKFGLITIIKKLLPFLIEAHPAWARQFVHEADVVEICARLALGEGKDLSKYEVFNIAPAQILTARDMARVLHKRVLRIPRAFVRPMFFIAWHLSLGRIPTHPDSFPGLIYPINVDGTKIAETVHAYRFSAEEAFLGKNGYTDKK